MTSEEKQKAIDALKVSAPIMAVTQEEFKDYIQTLNKIMDWLEQELCDDWCDVPSDEMTLEQARQAVRDLRKRLLECLEQEPTTKNCRSCRNFGSHHGICEICKDNKCWTEKEPTPKNDLGVDCISRDDVWDVMQELWGTSGELIDRLMALPSVTPQPKRGIWQQINKNEVNVIPEYKCSKCGAEYKGFDFDFDYCPRCGCAMEEEE